MGPCSLALYTCLTSDLSRTLHTVPYRRLYERNVRDAAWPGASNRQVASLALLDSIFKKFEDTKQPSADAAALAKFLACNSRCESFRTINTDLLSDIQAVALGEFRKIIYDFFVLPFDGYWLSPDSISERIATGPGASVGVTGTSFYHKIAAGPMTGTSPSLFSLYKRETSKFSLWSEAEKIRSDHYGEFKRVEGSRLSYVPKSTEISRTICTEPLLNMLFQKGVGALFESELDSRFGINLSIQPDKNRALARIGSIDGTYGTIDLSSASDSISLNLCREVLPRYVFSWLKETRSEFVTLPNGEQLKLHMVSSMGNAFTFPLQTILFAAVVKGVYSALDIEVEYPRRNRLGNFAVFGDDIIVRREAYDLVINLLERLGFEVNRDKSFNYGPFRESCGSDFWSGYNVRGVYCHSLKTKQDVYSLINRLNVWSANHCIPLTETIQFLIKESGVKFLPVPQWESDVAGIKVPLWLVDRKLLRSRLGSIVYSRYTPRTKSISLLDVGSRPQVRYQGKSLLINSPGILFAGIGGYLKDGNLSFKQQIIHYLKRLAVAPCWDYHDPCRSILTIDGWQRWKSFSVAINLGSGL